MPEIDARSVGQVDVKNDANRLFKISMVFKSVCRRKQDGFVRVKLEQPLESLKYSWVVIDD